MRTFNWVEIKDEIDWEASLNDELALRLEILSKKSRVG